MPMQTRHAVAFLLACTGLAAPALSQAAAEPRYTYGEFGYINADFDDYDEDGDGFGLGGSYALNKNVHLLLDYQDLDLGGSSDASAFSFGGGVNFPIRSGLDFVGRLRWIHQEVDVGNSGNDDDGFGLEAGIRTMINPQLELDGSVKYVDVNDEDDTSFVIGGLYELTPAFALGADAELSDNYTAFFLKARFYFNPPAQVR